MVNKRKICTHSHRFNLHDKFANIVMTYSI